MKTLNKAVARYNGISLIVRILIGLIIGAVLALLPAILFGGTAMQEERAVIWSISSAAIGVAALLVPLVLLLADYCRRRREARKENAR